MIEHIADLIFAIVALLIPVLGGSVGMAIVAVSAGFRIALLPVTLRVARRARKQREIFERLQPELRRLQERQGTNPSAAAAELRELYRRHGYQPFDPLSLILGLVQLPVMSGFCAAVGRGLGAGARFFFIGNLGAPHLALGFVAAALAYLGMTNTHQPGSQVIVLTMVLIAFVVAWRASAALGLYWASSNFVHVCQTIFVEREARKYRGRAAA
jgi:YidC/Oxa1 family membrane protein insertase